jgi:predicted secreted hydrolase
MGAPVIKAAIYSFCFLWCIFYPAVSAGNDFLEVRPGDRVELPRDLYYREGYRVQWWYFTGHLFDDGGREFGYELTFFAVGVQRSRDASKFVLHNVFISHFAISDVKNRKFYYEDQSDRGAFGFAGAAPDRLEVWVAGDRAEGSSQEIRLRARRDSFGLELKLVPLKPAALNGDFGYARKSASSPLAASLYFSYTNLSAKGKVRIGDTVYPVTGSSWFDREIASRRLAETQAGWDWFAVQLDSGSEIMLYMLREKDGTTDPFSSGTIVYRDGTTRRLNAGDFQVTVLAHYNSKKTGARYPSRWMVAIPSEKMELTVEPLMTDQEFLAPYTTWNYYWEGACRVEGSHRGRGYVEMTGY